MGCVNNSETYFVVFPKDLSPIKRHRVEFCLESVAQTSVSYSQKGYRYKEVIKMSNSLCVHDVVSVRVENWKKVHDYKVKKIRVKTKNGTFEITLFT